jgi:DNA repair exonuclease SbcCD ATPase subunit
MIDLSHKEHDQLELLLEKQKTLTAQYAIQQDQSNVSMTALKGKIAALERELEAALRPVDQSQILPLAAQSCPEFPRELQAAVQDIADNGVLQLPTKLRRVFSVVGRWFTSQSARIEEELAEERAFSLILRSQIESIAEFLGKTVPEVEFTSESLFEDKSIRVGIASVVTKLRDDCAHLLKMKATFDEQSLGLLYALRADTIDEAREAVAGLKRQIEELEGKLGEQRSRRIKQRKVHRSREEQFRKSVLLQEHLIDSLRQKVHELEDFMNSLNDEADQFRKDLQTKEGELDKSRVQYDELFAMNRELAANLSIETESRQSAEATVCDLKATIKEQAAEIHRLNKAIADLRHQFRAKLTEEKQANQSRFDSALEQMSQKNSAYLATIQQLNSQVRELEDRHRDLETRNAELTLRLQKQATQINALISEHDRDLKSCESQSKAKVMALESEFEEKWRKTQRAFALMNQTLQPFMANATLSVDNVEQAVNALARTFGGILERERRVREVLRIGPYDSIVDAVSQLTDPDKPSRTKV